MQSPQPSLFSRPDTFFGVCEAIGQDFGFNPNYLRVAFGATVLLSPVTVLATYVGLGAIVFASRRLFPARAVSVAATDVREPDAVSAPEARNDQNWVALAEAA